MPLYEYYCPPCGTQFEVLRPMSKIDDPAVCPEGHETTSRVISLFAAFFFFLFLFLVFLLLLAAALGRLGKHEPRALPPRRRAAERSLIGE